MAILRFFTSLRVVIICLMIYMLLIFVGTMDQVNLGIYAVQKKYFLTFFVFHPIGSYRVPVFPGGYLVGLILIVNLTAVFLTRFKFKKQNIGLIIIHAGIMVLMIGGGITSVLSNDGFMMISEGETKNYSESYSKVELAIINKSHPLIDTITSIPESRLKKNTLIQEGDLPFQIKVQKYLPNADVVIHEHAVEDPLYPSVDQGLGQGAHVTALDLFNSDVRPEQATAFVELWDGSERLGTWLFSLVMAAPQRFEFKGIAYDMQIRAKRYYNDYDITLKDFKHEIYAGTQIPKNFSSEIYLSDPKRGEERDALIYMNHPLRHRGKTYYQASFGQNDTMSILDVIHNPGWIVPYISCALVALGLLIQFMSQLKNFVQRGSRSAQ
ncbi:MAG: hypothetical protein ACI9CF_000598 [Candidatus Omnitrophota bacterium]|jgi:hypothetical protein